MGAPATFPPCHRQHHHRCYRAMVLILQQTCCRSVSLSRAKQQSKVRPRLVSLLSSSSPSSSQQHRHTNVSPICFMFLKKTRVCWSLCSVPLLLLSQPQSSPPLQSSSCLSCFHLLTLCSLLLLHSLQLPPLPLRSSLPTTARGQAPSAHLVLP